MSAVLSQSIIIENVTGADGTIGVGRAARAAPNGYQLSVGQWSTHVLDGAAYALPYDARHSIHAMQKELEVLKSGRARIAGIAASNVLAVEFAMIAAVNNHGRR